MNIVDITHNDNAYSLAEKVNLNFKQLAFSVNRLLRIVSSVNETTADASSGGSVNLVRNGNIVTIEFTSLNLPAALANNTTSPVLATIPEDYAPPFNVYGSIVIAGFNAGSSYFRITSSGNLTIRNQSGSSMSTTLNIAGTMTYVVK